VSQERVCRHCGETFTPFPGKPGYIDECPRCLSRGKEPDTSSAGGEHATDAESPLIRTRSQVPASPGNVEPGRRSGSAKPLRPSEPAADLFGLTEARVRQIENIGESWHVLGILAGLPIGCAAWVALVSVVDLLGFYLGLPLFLAVFLASGLLGEWLGDRCRSRQPDYPRYNEYKTAMEAFRESLRDYEPRYAKWERKQLDWWQSLSGASFETEVAKLLQSKGYSVTWTGRSGDQGVDLVLRRDDRTIIVQCKAHKQKVGQGPVRDLCGTMQHLGVVEAWLVSTSEFTKAAKTFAEGKQIKLKWIKDLIAGES